MSLSPVKRETFIARLSLLLGSATGIFAAISVVEGGNPVLTGILASAAVFGFTVAGLIAVATRAASQAAARRLTDSSI